MIKQFFNEICKLLSSFYKISDQSLVSRQVFRIKINLTMKFCANLSFMFMEGATVLERYALAKEAGFKAVESGFPVGFSIEEVVEAKNKSGLEQVLINICTGDPSKGELGVTAIPGKEKAFKTNLALTIKYAKALKIPMIHIMSGKVEGTVTDDNWKTYESNLKYASESLSKEGIVGVIEPINPHTVPKYFMNNFNKAVEIIERINSPHLKLQLDFFHLQQVCGQLSYQLQRLLPHVAHIQIAQVPHRHEPDVPGEVDYKYVLGLLEQAGYGGWVGLEYAPRGPTLSGLQWIQQYGYSL